MGIEALTHQNDGSQIAVPASHEDWQHWVSPGRTRNWMLDDPLLDWLHLYGENRGYTPKQETDSYVEDLDFVPFIIRRGQEFETGILRLLQEHCEVAPIAKDYQDIRRLDKAEETFKAMLCGIPIIYQAVLWDAHNKNYGSPDFLVRSDKLRELFPDSISDEESVASAPALGGQPWHYRVVDTKFTTLHLNANGAEMANAGSGPAYKAQLYLYNRMLGRLQGFEPRHSYVLGRGWEFKSKGVTYRGSSALERLGPIPQDGSVTNGVPIADAVEKALTWVRRVRTQGQDWQLLPQPSVPELYPSMSGSADDMMVATDMGELEPDDEENNPPRQWEGVKKWLAEELKELTQLWQVGVNKRKDAHAAGIYRWDDPKLTPAIVGVTGPTQAPVLNQLLAVNRGHGSLVLPPHIDTDRNIWHPTPNVEFYVDFEYCSDLNDDFSQLPAKGGQPLIFMIGCGHVEEGEWQFKSLTVNLLSPAEEIRIIREWAKHMATVRDRLDPACDMPRIIHWSGAEVTVLERSHSSAKARHGENADWPDLGWYDFLQNVMRREPVVLRGALGFGLKAVANALHSHGLIETGWANSPVDGLGAMVGAWRCDEEARRLGVSMASLPLMADIASYNEVDCKVMMEIVQHLRANH